MTVGTMSVRQCNSKMRFDRFHTASESTGGHITDQINATLNEPRH